ncbi:MAG TPA: hypothetical protein VJM08_11775 [Anaerolineales bacterium]|nr:hypothetical protein [Anaerolineales bacterium]
MKEHSQPLGLVGLVMIFVIAAFFFLMASNLQNMHEGANTIGEVIDNAIESSFDYNAENDLHTLEAADLAMMALTANKHAIERHGADALTTVECWNRNGTWRVYREGNTIFHMLCQDDDGSIRDIILERRSNTSNHFDMRSAYTPRDGVKQAVLDRLSGLKAELHRKGLPQDMEIFVDGVRMFP